jgi:hypothetical protein
MIKDNLLYICLLANVRTMVRRVRIPTLSVQSEGSLSKGRFRLLAKRRLFLQWHSVSPQKTNHSLLSIFIEPFSIFDESKKTWKLTNLVRTSLTRISIGLVPKIGAILVPYDCFSIVADFGAQRSRLALLERTRVE